MNIKIANGQVIKLSAPRRYGNITFEGKGEIWPNGFGLSFSGISVRDGYKVRTDHQGNIFVDRINEHGN